MAAKRVRAEDFMARHRMLLQQVLAGGGLDAAAVQLLASRVQAELQRAFGNHQVHIPHELKKSRAGRVAKLLEDGESRVSIAGRLDMSVAYTYRLVPAGGEPAPRAGVGGQVAPPRRRQRKGLSRS